MKENYLIYDINACPVNATMEDVVEAFQDLKVVIYDSSRGDRPVLTGKIKEFKFIDKSENKS